MSFLVNNTWDPIDVRNVLMTWFKRKAWPHRSRNM